jgi:hypothetical protein
MNFGMSRSMKRATIEFTMPDSGNSRITVQEAAGRPDPEFRALVRKTFKTFMADFDALEAKQNGSHHVREAAKGIEKHGTKGQPPA